MRAATVIASVLAQFQKLFNVQMPGFQVSAHRALSLAALIDRDRCVIDDLQEWHHPLGFTVGAFDVAAQCAHLRPVVAQAAGKLGQQRVFFDGVVNATQVVWYGGEVATRELRTLGATVEQCRGAGHEIKPGQHFIELDSARFAVDFVQGQAHGHTHEKCLRQFNALLANVQKIAVVKGLQAEVIELQVALRLERLGQALQIKLRQARVQ